MMKRFVWLALIALLVALSVRKISFHSGIKIVAPSTLVGYRLEMTNTGFGGPLIEHGESVEVLPLARVVTYFFWNKDEARIPEFDIPASSWTYEIDRNTGIVEIAFPRSRITDFIATCSLTFPTRYRGTHRCEFEDKDTGTQN